MELESGYYGQRRSTGGITPALLAFWPQKEAMNDLNGGALKWKEGQNHLEGYILMLYLMMTRSALVGRTSNKRKNQLTKIILS